MGLYLISNKHGISDEHARSLDKADVNRFDRFSAGNYDEDAKKLSDPFFYGSFASPLLLLLNDNIAPKAGQVAALFVETMAVTGTIFAMTAGNVYRLRPLAYGGDEVPLGEKTTKNARNSFFAGGGRTGYRRLPAVEGRETFSQRQPAGLRRRGRRGHFSAPATQESQQPGPPHHPCLPSCYR